MTEPRKWSRAEERELINEISDPSNTIEAIAKAHNRNPGGIAIRTRKLASEAIDQEPEKKSEILRKFRVTEEDIDNHKKLFQQKANGITTDKGRLNKIKYHIAEINKLLI